MFIGHYAAAPLGAATGKVKLWHGFVAVQLIDYAWAIFILLGIEKGRVVPGLTEASPLDLHFMPYTHSLLFCLFWAIIGGLGFKILTKAKGWIGALIIGALVLSHWAEDLIVHIPDLTIWPGSEKYGFGLWRHVEISFPLELLLMGVAMLYYLKTTQAVSKRSKMWAGLFIGFLAIIQVYANFGPAPGSINEVAISALVSYSILAVLAARFERTRSVISVS